MLVELTIDNFAIIDHLRMNFGPTFNVLTGETGAGKSIIIDAVASLLGGKLEQDQIRAGAEGTSVEAVFTLKRPTSVQVAPLLAEQGLLDGDETEGDETALILRRELRLSGRTVCRINGRAVPLKLMGEIGQYLIDIHGQSEHLMLFRRREQIGFLDRFGGTAALQARVAAAVRQLRQVRAELDSLRRDERELARRADLLQYEVGEIAAARLAAGEEEELRIERDRLANAEKLAGLADAICALLYEGDPESGGCVSDMLGQAEGHLADIAEIDPTLGPQRQALQEAGYAIDEVARALRSYRDEIEFNPRRLEQAESRLGLIYNLRRKYGDTILEILAYAERAADELSRIEHAGERIEVLAAQEDRLLRDIGRFSAELSAGRAAAGQRLAQAVEEELAQLRMERAQFQVGLEREEDPQGAWIEGRRYRFDASGVDRVEFLISANPGEPLRPLASVASGGETSRLMLALKGVLAGADQVPTLIFDEIDAGIGGVVGTTVGQKLARLAESHQVLCVTHLPQLAAWGAVQFKVEKRVEDGRTATGVASLAGEERVGELAGMMGSLSASTLQSAREMLRLAGG
jgi:DNA repair protein RecN (Recombination protein N)